VNFDDAVIREQDEKVKSFLQPSTDIAGATTGAAIGWLIGDPPGAVLGAGAGPAAAWTLRQLALEFRERVLGHREEVRVGAAITFATAKIKEKLEAGEQPRQDGFFTDAHDNRAAAKEVFEGVVLAAQREAEEKKVRLLGNLLANLAFEEDVDREQASLLVKLGEDLAYRQLCLLALFAQNTIVGGGNNRFGLRASDYRASESDGMGLIMVLQDAYALYQRGLVGNGGTAMIAVTDANPSQMMPVGAAFSLFNLMELWTLPDDDLNGLIRLLR